MLVQAESIRTTATELLMRLGPASHCQGQGFLTVFSRTDRTVLDYGVYAGHLAGR